MGQGWVKDGLGMGQGGVTEESGMSQGWVKDGLRMGKAWLQV